MKLETFISYPPRYDYRRVIPCNPSALIFTSMEAVNEQMRQICNELCTLDYVTFQIEPFIMDSNQTDPEFVYLHGDILKQTLVHFRITPDAPPTTNEPSVD